jgi:lipoprotein-anchoring transpeptidase ErfK/SrfK
MLHRALYAGQLALLAGLSASAIAFAADTASEPPSAPPAAAEAPAPPEPRAAPQSSAVPESPVAPETAPEPPKPPPVSIEIDLQEQKAYLLHDGRAVYSTAICSGRQGHLTPTGDFAVLEKDIDHKSSLYGVIVDSDGRVVVEGADAFMPVPRGCRFVSAPMKYFLRFDGASGLHAGHLPGYPASHGCVRLPAAQARLFFNTAEVGTPVHVFGKTPKRGPPSSSASVTAHRPPPAQTAARRGFPFFFPFFGR